MQTLLKKEMDSYSEIGRISPHSLLLSLCLLSCSLLSPYSAALLPSIDIHRRLILPLPYHRSPKLQKIVPKSAIHLVARDTLHYRFARPFDVMNLNLPRAFMPVALHAQLRMTLLFGVYDRLVCPSLRTSIVAKRIAQECASCGAVSIEESATLSL